MDDVPLQEDLSFREECVVSFLVPSLRQQKITISEFAQLRTSRIVQEISDVVVWKAPSILGSQDEKQKTT
jgi:hypothetical protein